MSDFLETLVKTQYLDGENSNIILESQNGEWLMIYGTQQSINLWSQQISTAMKLIASLGVFLFFLKT